MSEPLGSLCIVLHGHLPYVLRHGTHPHGEAWLYEAAAETYLPLLEMIDDVAQHRTRPALTVGLTPVLLEQLADDHFKTGFVEYLTERADRARQDRREFEGKGGEEADDFAALAGRWEKWYARGLAAFERLGRDLPGAVAARQREGHIQVLTSAATHAYLPLLLNDQMIAAQLSAGRAATARHLGAAGGAAGGASFRGLWLPECAYRPTWPQWKPTVLYDDPRYRPGLETFLARSGVDHFFVDTHLVANGQPVGTVEGGTFTPTDESQIFWDGRRGWRSPMEPVGVVSEPGAPKVFAFARHPRASEQVWSSVIGYPGSAEYLEFHRKHGEGGLRYHRVTSHRTPLHEKQPYVPEDTFGKLYEHSQHFCSVVKEALLEYKNATGRLGVVVAPFDAELFGHWWFEGPQFLRDVIFTLGRDPQVNLVTAEEALAQRPPDKVMRLPEGSWGQGGDHRVWINDKSRWMWEVEYRAEGRLLKLLHELPWRQNADVRGLLERAARELLLLQSSDWLFVIHSGGAVDYGIQRFAGHATRFDRACTTARHVAAGKAVTAVEKTQIDEMDAHDRVFREIELGWWM